MGYGGTSALTHPALSASSSPGCWHTRVFLKSLKSLPVLWVPVELGLWCADHVSPLCWSCVTVRDWQEGLGVIVVNLHFANSSLFTPSWIVSRKSFTEAGVNSLPGNYELCSVPSCGWEFCAHFHATHLLNVCVAVKNCSPWTVNKK